MRSRKVTMPDNPEGAGTEVEPTQEEMLLSKLVREWVHAKASEGCTRTTLKAYLNTGNQFCRWAGPRATHNDFEGEMLKNFVVYLGNGRKKPLNPNTIRGYLTHLSSLGDWLSETGWIKENPVRRLRKPRRVPSVRRVANNAEVRAMLDACARLPDKRGETPGRQSAKALAILSLMAFCGLRTMEILALRLADVRLSQRLVRVRGKGQKTRDVPLCEEVLSALRVWLQLRGELPQEALFDATPRRPMGQNTYYDLWRAIRASAGLKEESDLNPHGVRHNFAIRLDQKGAGLREIADVLGHSQTPTTHAYIQGGAQDMERIRDLASMETKPKARAQQKKDLPRFKVVRKRESWR